MRALFIKSERYVCDESSAGEPFHLRLPCTIFLAAAYCRQQGLNVDVLDVPTGNSYSYSGYDVVVAWIPLLEGFYDEIRYLQKAKNEDKVTIMLLNDPFEGLEMEAMEKYPFIDYIVRLYEREVVLGELLKELEKGNQKRELNFSGIIYRDGERIIDNGKRPPLDTLEHLPSTAEFLKRIDLSRYEHVFIEAGRGCPYSCTFCFYRKTKPRKRKIEDLLSELEVVAGKVNHIWLHDLNMLVDTKWTERLCDEIIKANIKAKWGTDARIDQCIENLDLLKKMSDAGCYLFALGLESADNKILEKIGKKTRVEYLDKAIKNCLAAEIKPLLNIMVGFPWDTNETLKELEDVLYQMDYNDADFQFVRPLRGTPLYQEYKTLGLLQRELTIDDYVYVRFREDRSLAGPLFPTLSLSKEELVEWARKLYQVAGVKGVKREIRGGKTLVHYSIKFCKKLFKVKGFNFDSIRYDIRSIKIFLQMIIMGKMNRIHKVLENVKKR